MISSCTKETLQQQIHHLRLGNPSAVPDTLLRAEEQDVLLTGRKGVTPKRRRL